MKSKSEKEKIELKKRLARVLRVSSNKTCADCPETRPTWISFIKPQQNFALGSKALASFVCLECAGLHRKLGTHICVVRSISHDQFEKEDVDCAEYSGNQVVNEIFEGHLQKSTTDGIDIKPLLGAGVARRERFIRQKYVDLYFYRKRAHYQHIAEVNKTISNSSKASKSTGSNSKSSPSKPHRKKLKVFLNEDNDATGCSTTVANTTMTPTNTTTSRTRTITDRDDSHKSNTHSSKRRDKKSSKKRSSNSDKTSTNRKKKGKKKSSSQRRLKAKDQTDPILRILDNGEEIARIGETSAPEKQPNIRKDLKLKDFTNSKENGDLSGMILVFDEESFESVERDQRERRSSKELDRGRRSYTISASSTKKPTIDSTNDHNDQLKGLTKKPSEVCDSRDPLASTLRDVRRSRSEIIIDEITKNRDFSISPGRIGGEITTKNLNVEPRLGIDRNTDDRYSRAGKTKSNQNKSSSARRLNAMSPSEMDTPKLKEHLTKNTSRNQNTSARNLKIPYLDSSPTPPISVEGIVSEENSYAFGDNTVNNMSGTGEINGTSNHEDNNTLDGFRMIDSEIISDRSSSSKDLALEARGSFSLPYKNKKATDGAIKRQSGRRGSGSTEIENILSCRDEFAARLDWADDYNTINKSSRSIGNKSFISMGSKSNEINKSSRSIGNKSFVSIGNKNNKSSQSIGNKSFISMSNKSNEMNKSSRSIGNKSFISTGNRSNDVNKSSRSIGNRSFVSISSRSNDVNKSSRSISNKSNGSSTNEPVLRIQSRQPENQERVHCDSPSTKKKKKRSSKKQGKRKSKRSSSKSLKSEKKLNLRNQALLDEWEKLRNENQRKFVEFQHFHSSF